jgi:transposase
MPFADLRGSGRGVFEDLEVWQLQYLQYNATREQVEIAKKQFSSYARKYPIIKSWSALPGIGIIRAATIFAYLDTPWRFKSRSKRYRYCGVGLVRITSGKDKKGRSKPARLKLPLAVNRRLKKSSVITDAVLLLRSFLLNYDYRTVVVYTLI